MLPSFDYSCRYYNGYYDGRSFPPLPTAAVSQVLPYSCTSISSYPTCWFSAVSPAATPPPPLLPRPLATSFSDTSFLTIPSRLPLLSSSSGLPSSGTLSSVTYGGGGGCSETAILIGSGSSPSIFSSQCRLDGVINGTGTGAGSGNSVEVSFASRTQETVSASAAAQKRRTDFDGILTDHNRKLPAVDLRQTQEEPDIQTLVNQTSPIQVAAAASVNSPDPWPVPTPSDKALSSNLVDSLLVVPSCSTSELSHSCELDCGVNPPLVKYTAAFSSSPCLTSYPSTEKLPPPRILLLRGLDGEFVKEFQLTYTRSDGDCAFSALGLPRERYASELLRVLLDSPNDPYLPEIRRLLTKAVDAEHERIQASNSSSSSSASSGGGSISSNCSGSSRFGIDPRYEAEFDALYRNSVVVTHGSGGLGGGGGSRDSKPKVYDDNTLIHFVSQIINFEDGRYYFATLTDLELINLLFRMNVFVYQVVIDDCQVRSGGEIDELNASNSIGLAVGRTHVGVVMKYLLSSSSGSSSSSSSSSSGTNHYDTLTPVVAEEAPKVESGVRNKTLTFLSSRGNRATTDDGSEEELVAHRFTKIAVPGDGDCGFAVLGVTRAEYAEKLLHELALGGRSAHIGDVRRFLSEGIQGESSRLQIPRFESLDFDYIQKCLAVLPMLVKSTQNTKLFEDESLRLFVRELIAFNGKTRYFCTVSDLELINVLFQRNIYIYEALNVIHEDEFPPDSYIGYSIGTTYPGKATTYLMHEGSHFDKLIPKETQSLQERIPECTLNGKKAFVTEVSLKGCPKLRVISETAVVEEEFYRMVSTGPKTSSGFDAIGITLEDYSLALQDVLSSSSSVSVSLVVTEVRRLLSSRLQQEYLKLTIFTTDASVEPNTSYKSYCGKALLERVYHRSSYHLSWEHLQG